MNPVIAYNYFQLPTYSFMLNIIVVPLLGIVVISAIAGSGMGFLSILMGKTALTPGCLILEVYTFLCENVLKIPGAGKTDNKDHSVILHGDCIFPVLFYTGKKELRKRLQYKRDD